MQAETLGVWYGADKLEPAQWIDLVTTVERLGYDTQWYSEAMGFESMAFGSFLLASTQRLKIGSSDFQHLCPRRCGLAQRAENAGAHLE